MSEIIPGMCLFLTAAKNLQTHLYVVISEPSGDPPTVALVNFSSYKDGDDETVIADVGDHPFFRRKSFVNYEEATVMTVAQLQNIMASNITARHQDDCSPELLKKVRDGVQESDFTSRKFQNYCEGKF